MSFMPKEDPVEGYVWELIEGFIYLWSGDVKVSELTTALVDLQSDHRHKYTNLTICEQMHCDDPTEYSLWGERLETKEETLRRILDAQTAKQAREEK